MSSPSLERKENHYSNDAVEKANENREKHGNSTLDHFLRKDEDDFNFFWQKSEVVRWKDHASGFHFHPYSASGTPICLLEERRVNKKGGGVFLEILIFVKFDHELARTSELDV